jgi:negative regulator of sigma-B (phosphoserine phosphatase)
MTGERGGRVERAEPDEAITWGVAQAPFPNELESGDRYLVLPNADGVLLAAVDGSGHGPEAVAAAGIAIDVLQAFAGESLIALILRCHEAMKGTRGVVMTLAFLDLRARSLTWLAVGNVEAVLVRAGTPHDTRPKRVLTRGGVVGYQLPPLRPQIVPLEPLDILIMATDGIEPDFADLVGLKQSPQRIADTILAKHRKTTDDALVVVARYLGDAAP